MKNQIQYIEIFSPRNGGTLWGARIQLQNPLNYVEIEEKDLCATLERLQEFNREVHGNAD